MKFCVEITQNDHKSLFSNHFIWVSVAWNDAGHKSLSFILKAGNGWLIFGHIDARDESSKQQPGSKTLEETSSIKWRVNFGKDFNSKESDWR